ncbi:MAG TPA: hypothetical protein VMF61_06830 [Candidatus Acidoferrales bacterium]|nr:hypothetical protein [Candidatus Acidoferrales bacterium]
MLKSLVRTIAVLAAASIALGSLPALADGMPDVYQQVVLPGANDAIKDMMEQAREKHQAAQQKAQAVDGSTVAQAPPVTQQPVGGTVGLPTGPIWSLDVSMAQPYGNIGSFGRQGWLMGGMDATLGYGISPTLTVKASMFQLQHWPYGFNSGYAPVYLQGFKNPVGCADLSGGTGCGPGTGRNLNVRTKDTFGVFMAEKLVMLGGFLPLVISPTYVARGGNIGESPTFNDQVPFTYNLPDGPYYSTLATRTAQYYAVAFTLPFLKSPKMFGTFTVVPQWLVHTAGVNTTNAMQLPQILYLEYTPTKSTTVWFEPQSARDYLPTDPYPEHLIAYFLGVSQHVTKYGFVQLVLNSGGPTNMGPDGVIGIKCLTVQQAINSSCGIAIGGLKATQLQLQFGIGSPTNFPL